MPVPGIIFGLIGLIAMALGVIIAKPALERGDLVEVTQVRLIAGVLGHVLWLGVHPKLYSVFQVFRPQPTWRTLFPAAFLGAYLSMLLWIGGFKWANASTAAVLNQMATVYTILLARVWLKEPLPAQRIWGCALALMGTLIVLCL